MATAPTQEVEELFDESPVILAPIEGSLDDRESEELVLINAVEMAELDPEQSDEQLLDIGDSGFGHADESDQSFVDNETVEIDASFNVELTALAPSHDDEGSDFSHTLSELHPILERDRSEEDGPFESAALTLDPIVPAFSLAEPRRRSTTVMNESQASALFATRSDRFARHDEVDSQRATSKGATGSKGSKTMDSVSTRSLLAFAFLSGPGSLSLDGGESFSSEPMLQSARCLAAYDEVLLAAVYDQPYDRCTVVARLKDGLWIRVLELAEGAEESEQALNLPIEMMVLHNSAHHPESPESAAQSGATPMPVLLVRLTRGCLVATLDLSPIHADDRT